MLKSPVSLQGGSFGQFSQIVIYHHGATSPALMTTNPGVGEKDTRLQTIMPRGVTKCGLLAIYFLSQSDVLKLPQTCVFAITTINGFLFSVCSVQLVS